MYPARGLLALGIAAFLAAMLVLAPLSRLQKLLPEASPWHQATVAGTPARGRIERQASSGTVGVSWDLDGRWLMLLGLGGAFVVDGEGVDAGGVFRWHPWGIRIDIEQARIEPGRLRALFPGSLSAIDQPLLARSLETGWSPWGGLQSVAGRLAWGPGQVTLANRQQPVGLPALRGSVTTLDGKIRLDVDGETAPGESLARLDFDPVSREIHLAVLQRAATLAGMSAGTARSPETVFFELRQPLR